MCQDNEWDWNGWQFEGSLTDEEVPSCIVCHLETVEFSYYSGTVHHYELVKFFIENGAVLKRFLIRLHDDGQENACVEQLKTIPKASSSIEIVLAQTVVV